MTLYVVNSGAYNLGIQVGPTLDLRIVRVEWSLTGNQTIGASVDKYTGSPTLTGGSVLVPGLAREGATNPPATALAKFNCGTGGTITGGNNYFGSYTSPGYSPDGTASVSFNPVFTPPTALILKAGSGSIVIISASSPTQSNCTLWFEELRLNWSV